MRWLGIIAILYAATCAFAWNPVFQSLEIMRPISTSIEGLLPPWGDSLNSFWDKAQNVDPKVGEVVLSKVTDMVAGTTAGAKEFRHTMDQLVDQAREIRLETMAYLELDEMGSKNFFEALASELGVVYKRLQEELIEPLPNDHSKRAEHREQLVKHILENIRPVYIKLLSKVLPKEKAETQFDLLAPKLTHAVVVTGKLNDEYPVVLTSMLFVASTLLLPEIQILQPIMSMFGFGPLGPIKGSAAAWAQSRFWGAAVTRGSWFAVLQKVGMTLTGKWYQKIAASTALVSVLELVARSRNLIASLFSWLR